ncbi:hypothetical protein Taro_056464, partial [Colocasia esculenta]|nr:hypothetical protein [Colocasia esculenta]
MGQAIRSRNLRKSGFSVVIGVWTKTSVAEGEPILGEAQEVQLKAVAAKSEGPSAVAEPAAREAATPSTSLEVAAITEVVMETPVAEENSEVSDSVRRSEDPLPTSPVASLLRQVLDSIHSSQVDQNTGGSLVDQSVAPSHIEDSVLIDAPIQGEQHIEKEAASQGALSEDAPVNEEQQKKFLKKMHLKPILKRLDDQGAVLDSVNSAVNTVIERQASLSNDIFQSNVAMKWFNKELSSMKLMLSEVLKAVGPKHPTPQDREPSGPSEVNAGPSGQVSIDLVKRPSGPSVVAPAGPSGPSVEVQPSKKVPSEDSILCQESGPEKDSLNPVDPIAEQEDQVVAPEPPAYSSLTTPATPSPPSSSTTPQAPTTFKRPRSRSVSSPQPLSSQLASSPASSTLVPPPPSSPLQLPPASSSAGPSSSGPSTSEPFFLPIAQQSQIFSMTEAKNDEQWARSNKDLYSQFRQVQVARYPPREAPLPLSEWFQIHHKNLFGPFIQKEIKFIRQYQMYSNYCYVNRLPESQLGQFRTTIKTLSSSTAHTKPLQVDFATLVIPDVVFLPPLHALIMDSSVGTLIFKRAARVMARLFVQDGRDLSFPRFVFRQYLQGHIKVDVLAPILSECERLSPEEWMKLYPLSAQQLGDLNASQASSNQPPLSP